MRSYRRRLPHVDAPGVPAFVTWRVYGSLPRERTFPREHLSSGEAFAAFDQLLDSACTGPLYLRRPEIAVPVRDQLRQVSAEGSCSLHAYVVMPNHVHVLWTPRMSLSTLVRQVKGPSALAANRLLRRTGEPFWQSEYFDRQVPKRTRVRADPAIYRMESGEGGPGSAARGLPVVQRLQGRAGFSPRGTLVPH
jgi:putative transposase